MLLREHLQGQHREGSIVSERNLCKLNRGCDRAGCGGNGRHRRGGTAEGGTTACLAAGEVSAGAGAGAVSAGGEERSVGGGGGGGSGETSGRQPPRGDRGSDKATETGATCVPTAEEEGLPLPAAMTLRFLAAMDEGYIGSRREENARLKRRRMREEMAG